MYNELKLTLDLGKIGEYKMIGHDDGRMVSSYNVGYECGYRTAKEQCKNKNEKILLIVLIFIISMVIIVYSFV